MSKHKEEIEVITPAPIPNPIGELIAYCEAEMRASLPKLLPKTTTGTSGLAIAHLQQTTRRRFLNSGRIIPDDYPTKEDKEVI